jgi:hypothetical protein
VTAKVLTRKITRKQALSYSKTVPNRLGVTALAELNGPGAWQRRYDLTKQILSGKRVSGTAKRNPDQPGRGQEEPAMANPKYTPRQRSAMVKMSPARRAAFKAMLGRSPDISTLRRNKATKKRGRAMKRNEAATTTKPRKKARTAAQKAATKRMQEAAAARRAGMSTPVFVSPSMERDYGAWGGPTASGVVVTAGGLSTGRARKVSRKEYLESKVVGEGWSYAKADAAWRRKSGKVKPKARGPRTYGGRRGKYTALDVNLGKRRIKTYLYRGKKGRVAHIPEFAVLGYPSEYAMELEQRNEKGKARVERRKQLLDEHRQKVAAARTTLILKGRDPFSPNPADSMSWEEWKSMNPNAKKKAKKAKKAKKGHRTAAQKAATRKLVALNKARAGKKRGKGRSKPKAKAKASRSRGRQWGALRKGRKLAIIMQPNGAAAYEENLYEENRRGRRRRKSRKHRYDENRSAAQKAATRKLVALNKARAGKKRGKGKGKSGRGRRGPAAMYMTLYSKNAMRRRYEENAVTTWVEGLKEALKIGGIVVVGYAAHRALTKVLSDQVLGKLDAFKSGTLGAWRDSIAGFIVAAAGVPLAVKLIPGESAAAGAGMAASFLHGIIIKALTEAGQPEVASYLSAYPDASGPAYKLSGMGSYYTFRPHQLYPVSGMGEYITQSPNLRYNQLTQPMSGMGNNGGAIVTQPAAGTGEYLVYGAEGVGDYSEVPVTPSPMVWDDGVLPTLDAAERALNVMEAAAGVGSSEIPLQSTVNPVDYATPIGDEPTGSRSGVFEGGGGIFG